MSSTCISAHTQPARRVHREAQPSVQVTSFVSTFHSLTLLHRYSIKCSDAASAGMKLKSHVVCVQQAVPDEQLDSWTGLMEHLPAAISVYFSGPKNLIAHAHAVPALNTLLSGNVPRLLELLKLLGECSPEHARPQIIAALNADSAVRDVAAIRERILADAVIADDVRARRLAAVIEARVSDIADVRDEGGLEWVALHPRYDDVSNAADDARQARMIAQRVTHLTLPHGEAENEFRQGAAALSRAFPLVFPLGSDRAFKKAGICSVAQMRHVLLQFTCAASHQKDLLFYFQDVIRRHAVLRSVAAFIKTGKMQEFHALVSSPEFTSLLERAREGHDADADKAVANAVRPFIRTAAISVPNGPAIRRQAVSRIYAMTYYLGLPSTWVTMSYDCVASATAIQMSFPTVASGFPLDDFLRAFSDTGAASFSHSAWPHVIDLTAPGLNSLCSKNPVAAAEVFATKTSAILSELLGIPCEANTKQSQPSWRVVGIFGTPYGFYLVVEAQGRGSLHWHCLYWGSYSPQLLLAASTSPRFKAAVERAYSTMTVTELPRDLHLSKLTERAQRAQGIKCTAPLERPSRSPRDSAATDPQDVIERARLSAIATNVHTHSQTCHKGETGECRCRMCYPEGYVMHTVFRSIEAAPEGATPVYVENMAIPDPPASATAYRNLEHNPLPAIDPRIVVLDGQRRTLSSLTPDERQLLASSAGLPPASVDWIARVLPLQQALVVPFNTVMVSVEPCNMASVPTGTATGAKSCTYYQAKYSGKDRCVFVVKLSHTLTRAPQQPDCCHGLFAADGKTTL